MRARFGGLLLTPATMSSRSRVMTKSARRSALLSTELLLNVPIQLWLKILRPSRGGAGGLPELVRRNPVVSQWPVSHKWMEVMPGAMLVSLP